MRIGRTDAMTMAAIEAAALLIMGFSESAANRISMMAIIE